MKKLDLVCIVEDDPIQLFLTKKFVQLTGLVEKILICTNGKDAYETLTALFKNSEQLPRIIFLDLNMPVWDGWEFLEEFIKIPIKEKITIYILTSSENEDDLKRAEMYNLRGNYLIKPITLAQLTEALTIA